MREQDVTRALHTVRAHPGIFRRSSAIRTRPRRHCTLVEEDAHGPCHGRFVQSNSSITNALREQEQDALIPFYGRHDTLCGDICLSCTHGMQSVYVKVRTPVNISDILL